MILSKVKAGTLWTSIFTLVAACNLEAQSPDTAHARTQLSLEKGSEFILEGRSTLHGYKCRTSQIEVYEDKDPNGYAIVNIIVPVKNMTCGNKKLERNLFKALKADEHPEIRYTLDGYSIAAQNPEDRSAQNVTSHLAVGGNEKDMVVYMGRTSTNGVLVIFGEHKILMTDFGIKPPTIMRGVIRVANEVYIRVNLKLKRNVTL